VAGAPPNREVRRVRVADYPFALRDRPVVQRTRHPAGHLLHSPEAIRPTGWSGSVSPSPRSRVDRSRISTLRILHR